MYRIFFLLLFLTVALLSGGCGSGESGQKKMAEGIAAFKSKDYAVAVACLTEAGQRITGSVDLYYLLGSAHLMRGEMGRAGEAFHAALQCKPQHGESLAGLAEIAFHNGQLDEARKGYDRALAAELSTDDSRAAIYNGLAMVCAARKEYASERLFLLEAQRATPKYAPTYYNLGSLYRDGYKLYDEALDQFNLYLRLAEKTDPHREKAENKIKQLQGLLRRNVAKPVDPSAVEKAAKLVAEGSEALGAKSYIKALQSFKEAIALDPLSFNAQWGLGMAYTRQGLKAEALEAFRRSARLKPTHQESYARAGAMAFRLNRYKDAEDVLNMALARSPFTPETVKQLSSIYYYQKRNRDARAYGMFYLSLLKPNAPDTAFENWLKTF